MDKLSYRRHRFPNIVIQQAVETVRRWALKFGGIIARKLRRGRPRPDGRWHLDEVFVSTNGRQLYVWRAVDSEGEVLDILVQPRRDRKAALKLMRKLEEAWRHSSHRCDRQARILQLCAARTWCCAAARHRSLEE
jgi:transposase-like protein